MTRRLSALLAFVFAPFAVAADKPLAAAVQPFVERGNLAGAVMLVADKDKTLALEAAGYSDVAAKTPMTTDAVFWIASQSKPITAGGLFSTAEDLARFCRLVLNDGVFEGKRYLSAAAVAEMTRRQTPERVKESYGLGWATGGGTFGHGGAFATNMTIDPKHQRILIWMVQHAGFPGDGDKAQGAFRAAASKAVGP